MEFIPGIIIILVPLLVVLMFFIKWMRDYKKTKKIFVLYDRKTKYWVLVIILLIIVIYIIYSEPNYIKECTELGCFG